MIDSAIFRTALKEVIWDKIWIACLVLIATGSLFGVYLAPIVEDPAVLAPTRAQLAWILAWAISLFWVNGWAATLSCSQVSRNHRAWWKSFGVNDGSYFRSIAAVPLLLNALVFGMAAAISLASGRNPGTPFWGNWLPLVSQAWMFAMLSQSLVVFIVVGLGNRMGTAACFGVAVGINLYGLCLMGMLNRLRDMAHPIAKLAEVLWTLTPHLYFGNLISRITFGLGPLGWKTELEAAGYFLGWGFLTYLLGRRLFAYRAMTKK